MAKPTLRKRDEPDDELPRVKPPQDARFQVRVDRQTKASYETAELANAAALDIKTRYPVVQVSVFDGVERTSVVVQLPHDGSAAD